MIENKMLSALNGQVNGELYSAYLYLSMSAQFQADNLPGLASWMTVQAQEEMGHAMRIYKFILARGGKATLTAIAGPPTEWASPLAAFKDAYKHEQKVTGLIDELVALAAAEKDNATGVFLQWFVTEQVEEESSVDAVVRQLELAGESPNLLLLLDRELGQRTAGAGEE